MLSSFQSERNDRLAPSGAPHLSHSRVSRYLVCPEQYRLYYVENLRPKVPSASLVFGQIMHQALACLFRKTGDPIKHFEDSWGLLRNLRLGYNDRESWAKLNASGPALLRKFIKEEQPKLSNIRAVEKPFTHSITNLDLPFVGIVDLDADLHGKSTLVDFKTSGSRYDEFEAQLSDQLSAYQLAVPDAEQLALCVLVKTKEPKIEWHVTTRTGAQLTEYLIKAGYIAHDIADGRFFKRPGKHCAWCDFQPICLGQTQKANETLVAIA